MFFFGYWSLGNMQIFSNNIVPLVNSGVPLTTDHTVAPSGNQALPLFIVGIVVLIAFIAVDCCTNQLKKCNLIANDEI